MVHDVAIMKFIYDKAVAAVTPVPVYQSVTDGAVFPYVEINSLQSLYEDIVIDRRYRHIVRLHVWSNYRGQLEVIDLMDKLEQGLHRQRDIFTGGRINDTIIRSKNVIRDVDNITFSGMISIEIDSEVTA